MYNVGVHSSEWRVYSCVGYMPPLRLSKITISESQVTHCWECELTDKHGKVIKIVHVAWIRVGDITMKSFYLTIDTYKFMVIYRSIWAYV